MTIHITGDPDGPPTKSGLSLVDLSAGYVSALATLSAIHRARRDGVGGDCDISLFETALAELSVRSVLSFAPKPLRVPAGMNLRRVDLSTELQILAYLAVQG